MKADHETYMVLALEQAKLAALQNEVPVGAVLVSDNGILLAKSHNQTITLSDPTAHAEILALREGAKKAMNYRLIHSVLYVTIEPCIMCMGALIHARISKVVFGAHDPKWGACGSLYDLSRDLRLNHRMEWVSGIKEQECRLLIQDFFRAKRKNSHSENSLI